MDWPTSEAVNIGIAAKEHELMTRVTAARRIRVGTAFLGIAIAAAAHAQTAPAGGPPGPSPARQAVDARRAAFVLIGGNFRPLGGILKGAPVDAVEVEKRANRLVFLASLLDENFPDSSNLGQPDTKAKADLWANRGDFDQKLKGLQSDLSALAKVSADRGTADAIKTDIAAVGQDCKGCHDKYREQ
jgi:cytochrome c556